MTQPNRLDRRSALASLAGATAALVVAKDADALTSARAAPAFEISLAEWSLHREIFGGKLDHLDFPRLAAERFDLRAVEYVNGFFKDKVGDFAYLADLRRRAADQGVESRLIMIDGEGDLAHSDERQRRTAIERHMRWVAAARALDCKLIRVNAHGDGPREEQAARMADSLHHLAEWSKTYQIAIIVENHGGFSSDGAWLADVMRRAKHPEVGTLPDFGNFDLGGGQAYDRYLGVSELMPFAKAVSAKSYDFDARGEETTIDYRRMLAIVQAAGYHGFIGIEYEGSRLGEHEGIQATQKLLERCRAELPK